MSDTVQQTTDEYRIYAAGGVDRKLSDRQLVLKVFADCVYRGVWCEVWAVTTGVTSAIKIADYPGVS